MAREFDERYPKIAHAEPNGSSPYTQAGTVGLPRLAVLPVRTLITMFIIQQKTVMLTLWTVSIIVVDTYLIVV